MNTNNIIEWIMASIGLSEQLSTIVTIASLLIIIVACSILANWITKKFIIGILKKIIKHSKTKWDDVFFEKGVFTRLSHIIPALIIYYFSKFTLQDYEGLIYLINAFVNIYFITIAFMVFSAFFNALETIYNSFSISKDRPIRGYIQVAKIFVYFIGGILIISIIFGKSPVYFLTGMGAMAAVLMLVFKDTIMGFVSGIQLTANDMVRIGDWISMPSHKADGTVEEITLNTVKVKNWDKTISTIPTYALISESFSNWRGMEESGGRRIKRSINIDMKSVKFCSSEMIDKYRKIKFIKPYVEAKLDELSAYNEQNGIDESSIVNGRRMTNLGTFRKYVESYLRNHPKVHQEMTFLIRHLQPTEKGLPIEIYVFSNDQAWANYEAIQADIFDHIIAVIPEFELKVFQNPTGDDFQKLVK